MGLSMFVIAAAVLWPAQVPPAADRPPRAVVELRDAALSAWRPALEGDWTTASERLQTIQSAVTTLPARAGQPDLRIQLRGRIAAFRDAIKTRRGVAAAMNANWIGRLADEMADQYETAVPGDVRLLGFFGRAAEIDAIAHRRAKVKSDLSGLRTAWHRVEPMVLQRNATDAARRFSDAVVQLSGASTTDQQTRAAEAELDAAQQINAIFSPTS